MADGKLSDEELKATFELLAAANQNFADGVKVHIDALTAAELSTMKQALADARAEVELLVAEVIRIDRMAYPSAQCDAIYRLARRLREDAKPQKPRPRIVCLCGSTRFMEAFQKANLDETLAGRIVLSVGCNTKSDGDLFKGADVDEIKKRLDELHKRKIDLADEVLVLDVGGYVGESTKSEIVHAVKMRKPIRYLSKEQPAVPSPAPAKAAASEPADDEQAICVPAALEALTDAFKADEDFAWGWHCNLACAAIDEGIEHGAANRIASRFMKLAFKVDTKEAAPGEPADHSGEAGEKVEQHLCPDCNQPLTCLASDGSARVSHCNSCDCTVGNSLPLTKEAIDTMEAIVRHAEESHRDADREVAEHAERRFVCPHCGERRYIAERIGVTTGPEAFEYCCPKGHKSTWAEVEAAKDGPITAATTDIRKIVEKSNATDAGNQAAEVEAANGEREQGNPCAGIFDHKWLDPVCVGGGCQSLVLARVSEELKAEVEWRSLGIKSRDALILRLKQQLAAATQAREAEKQRADDTQVRLEAFERSPDKKQKSIWELEEAVSEAEERANENARLLHEQRQRAEAAEAAAGVMKSALTKGDELNLNNNRGVSVYDALRRLRDGSMSTPDNSWFGWAFDRIDKALATDPGRAANELRAGKALAGKIRDALCSVEAIAHVERALADYDQALAQGEQCGEVR